MTVSSRKHIDREMKSDLQGMVTAGNGYDSLCYVLSPSKKGYSGQDVAHCNPDLPVAGILETTDAPEVVEAGKGYPCEQSLVPKFDSGIEEGRGNGLGGNNGDRKGESSPVK